MSAHLQHNSLSNPFPVLAGCSVLIMKTSPPRSSTKMKANDNGSATDTGNSYDEFRPVPRMNPKFLSELSRYPSFPKTADELIRIAGIEAASRLISFWGGQEWPVPMHISGPRLSGRRRGAQLTRLIGEQAALRVIRHWGGSRLLIPNLKEVRYAHVQRLVRADFDRLVAKGSMSYPDAVFDLGIRYGLTGKAIENVLKKPDVALSAPKNHTQE